MARGVGYESLAALVDYLTKQEEDRQVPLSALADAARQGIGQGVVDPAMGSAVDFLGADRAATIGQMTQATPAGLGAIVTEDTPALLDMADPLALSSMQRQALGRETGAKARGAISGLADLVAKEGPMEVATRGLRAADEGIGQLIDERGFAAFAPGPEDALPGSKILAALGMAVPAMRMGKGAAKAAPVVSGVKQLETDLLKKYPDLKQLNLFDSRGDIELNMIAVDKAAQKQGVGSAVMQDITDFADGAGKRVVLTTGVKDPDFGTTSAARLKRFYKRFGFVENKGRNKDFTIKGNLLRNPQEPIATKASVEPPRRSLLEQLAEGVEDPGALERGRLEGGDKVLRPGYDEDYHDKLLRQLNEALANNDTEAIKKGEDELSKMLLVEPVTPEIESQRISQLAALDALDPVEKARLDRAVEQGFDLDGFHGTRGNIEAFDPGLLGETTKAPSARMGYFFSADTETASTYAKSADIKALRPDTEPVYNDLLSKFSEDNVKVDEIYKRKEKKVKEVFNKQLSEVESKLSELLNGPKDKFNNDLYEALQQQHFDLNEQRIHQITNIQKDPEHDTASRIRANALREVQELARSGENIIPVKLRLQNPLEHDFKGEGYRDVSYQTLLENAKNKGHDGAIFRNTTDGGGMTDIYVVFEPAQIRSRYAAFDPKAPGGTGDITASFAPLVLPLGGGTAAAAYLANQEQE